MAKKGKESSPQKMDTSYAPTTAYQTPAAPGAVPVVKVANPQARVGIVKTATDFLSKHKWVWAVLAAVAWLLYTKLIKPKKNGNGNANPQTAAPVQPIVQVPPAPAVDPNFTRLSSA